MGQAKRYREEHDPAYFDSLAHLYYFEKFYQFGSHLFDEPEERSSKRKGSKEYYEDVDRQSKANVIDFLERLTKRKGSEDAEVPGGDT